MAWTAMALGVAIPLLEGMVLERFQSAVVADMDDQATATVTAMLRGEDLPTGRVLPPATGGPPPEEWRALARTLEAELGDLREVRITNRTAAGLLDPVVSATFIAEFARGSAFGNAEFTTGTLQRFAPTLILTSLELEAQGRRHKIPAVPTAPPEPLPSSTPDSDPATDPAPASHGVPIPESARAHAGEAPPPPAPASAPVTSSMSNSSPPTGDPA